MNRTQRVLRSSISVIRRDWLIHDVRSWLSELDGNLGEVKLRHVPVLSELVAVVDQAISSENANTVSAN
jgi:hypothetical protein